VAEREGFEPPLPTSKTSNKWFLADSRIAEQWGGGRTLGAAQALLRLGNVVDRDADDGARTMRLITIESLRRGQPRRFHAATFLLPLPRRFHERNFGPKSAQQKAIENDVFSMA
jgi:hypothetical protein